RRVRWASEPGVLLAALVKPFSGERRRVRHQATLEQAAQYSGSPALWAMSVGSSAIQHVINRVVMWRHDPRPRRALVAAPATAAAPVMLALLALQAFAPRPMPDLVSPLGPGRMPGLVSPRVRGRAWRERLCGQDRVGPPDRLDAEQPSMASVANPVGPPS